jgi:hypothetical protein
MRFDLKHLFPRRGTLRGEVLHCRVYQREFERPLMDLACTANPGGKVRALEERFVDGREERDGVFGVLNTRTFNGLGICTVDNIRVALEADGEVSDFLIDRAGEEDQARDSGAGVINVGCAIREGNIYLEFR